MARQIKAARVVASTGRMTCPCGNTCDLTLEGAGACCSCSNRHSTWTVYKAFNNSDAFRPSIVKRAHYYCPTCKVRDAPHLSLPPRKKKTVDSAPAPKKVTVQRTNPFEQLPLVKAIRNTIEVFKIPSATPLLQNLHDQYDSQEMAMFISSDNITVYKCWLEHDDASCSHCIEIGHIVRGQKRNFFEGVEQTLISTLIGSGLWE